jgi:hypothetical protein
MKKDQTRQLNRRALNRRVFLRSAAAAGGAAVVTGAAYASGESIEAMTPSDGAQVKPKRIAKAPKDYAESEHVKTYLRLARF